MTRLELAKHTVDTIYDTLLTLVNEGIIFAVDAEDLLYSKCASIRQSLVDDDSVSPEEFFAFLDFCQERVYFFTNLANF